MKSSLALVLAGSLSMSGCSFVFSQGPPVDHEHMPYFDCVSTYGLPVADGFIALSGIAGAAATLSKSKEEFAAENKNGDRNTAAGVNIALSVVTAASAVYGIVQATRCTNAKNALQARVYGPLPPFPGPAPMPSLSLPPPGTAPAPPIPQPAPPIPQPAPPTQPTPPTPPTPVPAPPESAPTPPG